MAKRKNNPDVSNEEPLDVEGDETLNLSDVIEPVPTNDEVSTDYVVGMDEAQPNADQAITEVVNLPTEDSTVPATRLSAADQELQQRQYRVVFNLPLGVLAALMEPDHALADYGNAVNLDLIHDSEVTDIGKLVLAGIDQTAIRHKLLAGYRAALNAQVDNRR